MNFFRNLFRQNIYYWAALAGIVTLFVTIFIGFFPDPLRRANNSPVVAPTTIAPSESTVEAQPTGSQVVESEFFYLPWTRLLTTLYKYSPPATWWLISITFSIAGFIIGIAFFNWAIDNEEFKIIGGLIIFVVWLWLSIDHWGWWGILIGLFVSMLLAQLIAFGLVSFGLVWGGILGIITGGIIGVGVTLLVVAFFGNFIESYLVVGNILGSVIGALLGGILGNSL